MSGGSSSSSNSGGSSSSGGSNDDRYERKSKTASGDDRWVEKSGRVNRFIGGIDDPQHGHIVYDANGDMVYYRPYGETDSQYDDSRDTPPTQTTPPQRK